MSTRLPPARAAFIALLAVLGLTSCKSARARREGVAAGLSVGALPAPQEGYLAGADGARLFYRVVGRGRDTVVVVHGGPGAGMGALYADVLPLAERHTLVFYDQRGGGRSTLPADTTALGPRHHVEDLERVRQHFRLERMAVIAHSFGPVLVAKYLESYPERVSRLVFLGASGPRQPEAGQYYQALYAKADPALLRRQFTAMRPLLAGTAPDVVAGCRALGEVGRAMTAARGEPVRWRGSECDMPPEALRYYYRYTARVGPALFGAWDFTRSLRGVRAPLLVVYGALDTAGVPMQRAWAAALPDARLLLVPGAGKGAMSDRPELVFPAVERFLRGGWPEAAEALAP